MSGLVRKFGVLALAVCGMTLAFSLLGSGVSSAQPVGAAVSGVVTDESGAVVSGTWLSLADAASGVQRQATANERGEYAFAGLPPGRYVLSAGRGGFAPLQIANITLVEGQQRAVPVTLKVAPLSDTVSVTGATGYRTEKPPSIGPWEGRTLQDTPYSVTVIPSALIENLQATTPDQIYRVTPTVQFVRPQRDNDQPQIFMRGFRVLTSYRDGLPASNFAHGMATEDADSVEVLTGLSGFLYGPGNVGGVTNYTSKRPTAERFNRVTLGNSGGSNYYAQGDFGGPIDRAGRTGYRVNGIWQDGDIAIDHQDVEKRFISGAFDWRVTDRLVWRFDAAYRNYNVHGGVGAWTLAPGASPPAAEDIDASVSWGQQWTDHWFKATRYGTQVRWEAHDALTLRAGWGYNKVLRSFSNSVNQIQPDGTYTQSVSGLYAPGDDALNAEMSGQSGQAFADLRFDTGAIAHKLTTGVQYQRNWQEWFANSAPNIVYTGLPLEQPTYVAKPTAAHVDRGVRGSANDYSYTTVLLGDDITFGKRWSALVGAAHSTVDRKPTVFYPPPSGYRKTSAVTPNVSLLYKPAATVTTYASYIQALEQGGVVGEEFNGLPVVNRGEVLQPLISDQFELGAKWSLGGLLVTTALFQIDKALEYHDLSNPDALRYVQDGRQVHRGFELTVFGTVVSDLTVTGGVTLLDATVRKQRQTPALEGKQPISVAGENAKLRAEYRLPAWPKLTVIGAVSYTGSQYVDVMNTQRLPAYTVLDIGARYQATVGQRPVTLRLDVNNLTNKAYWSWATTLGDPRTVLFSVSTGF